MTETKPSIVTRLEIHNVKGIIVIDLKPRKTVNYVKGLNEAGKSTILDCIAYALGGKKLIPNMPLRTGESKGEICVHMDPYKITRTFTEKGTYLKVETPDGSRFPKPQEFLDALLIDNGGAIAFDPHAFMLDINAAGQAAAQRKDMLLKALNIPDVTEDLKKILGVKPEGENTIEKCTWADEHIKLQQKELRAVLKHLNAQIKEDVPEVEEPDIMALRLKRDEMVAENAAAKEFNDNIAKAKERVQWRRDSLDELQKQMGLMDEKEAKKEATLTQDFEQAKMALEIEYQKKLEQLRETHRKNLKYAKESIAEAKRSTEERIQQTEAELAEYEELAKSDEHMLKDVAAIDEEIRLAEEQHEAAKLYQEQRNLLSEIERQDLLMTGLKGKREEVAKVRTDSFKNAKSSIKGLGFDDQGTIVYKGHPIEQCSTSKLYRLATAWYVKLQPTLRVMLIRRGNDLDNKSMGLLERVSAEYGLQMWVEKVAQEDDGEGFFIEEGRLSRKTETE